MRSKIEIGAARRAYGIGFFFNFVFYNNIIIGDGRTLAKTCFASDGMWGAPGRFPCTPPPHPTRLLRQDARRVQQERQQYNVF